MKNTKPKKKKAGRPVGWRKKGALSNVSFQIYGTSEQVENYKRVSGGNRNTSAWAIGVLNDAVKKADRKAANK